MRNALQQAVVLDALVAKLTGRSLFHLLLLSLPIINKIEAYVLRSKEKKETQRNISEIVVCFFS